MQMNFEVMSQKSLCCLNNLCMDLGSDTEFVFP